MADPDPTAPLHPEGAPGVYDTVMRSFLGDQRFEANQQMTAKTVELAEKRLKAQTDRARSVATLLALLAVVALACAPAVVIWVWSVLL